MADEPKNCEWEEKLQDSIDGDLDPGESVALNQHIAGCTACQAQRDALQALDAALAQSLLKETLSESFDHRVLERVSTERADQATALARVEHEWQAHRAALSRQWRNALRSMILNTLAGVALLVTLLRTLGIASWVSRLAQDMDLLTFYAAIRPIMTVSIAAGLTVITLWVLRALALR